MQYQKEITKPYSIKISILNSIKYKVSQFLWSKIIRTRELMIGNKMFSHLSFPYWFLFSFSFDLLSFSSFISLSSQQTKDKYSGSCPSLIINNIRCITRHTGNTPYIKLTLLLHSKRSFS